MKHKKILLTKEEIERRLDEVAGEVEKYYSTLVTENNPLAFVVVLKGAYFVATELAKRLNLPLTMHFIRLKSYSGRKSTGEVNLIFGVDENMKNRHVLIVEDIVDTGLTVKFLKDYFEVMSPASCEVFTLLRKPASLKYDVDVKFCCFDIEDKFVYGYGLDLDEVWRNLPFVAYVEN